MQTILSLSSGEVEFYEAVWCVCRTLGLKSLLWDLSLEVEVDLVTESWAVRGCVPYAVLERFGSSTVLRCGLGRRRSMTDWDHVSRGERNFGSRCRDLGFPEATMWRSLGMLELAIACGRAKHVLKMVGRLEDA